MIKATNIKKSFGDVEVLKGIDMDFHAGKTNLIIGRSGAGKTVFLKILVGLFEPTSGDVMYGDVDFFKLDKKGRRQIRMEVGMLFQGSALFDSMTVEENIRFPLDMFTNNTRKEKQKRVDYCLERVNLEGTNKKYRRARSIVLEPKYLFCDEPNSGLDPKTSIVIDELIKSITKENNITTVINTHDMNSVMEIGDNIALLAGGHLVWQGNKSEVLNSDNEELKNFIFASPFLQKLRDAALSKSL